jgi:hypothetical protein
MNKLFEQIELNEKWHIYSLKGRRLQSVSKLTKSITPYFNQVVVATRTAIKMTKAGNLTTPQQLIEQWNEKGRVSREKGTATHEFICQALNNEVFIEPPELYFDDKTGKHHLLDWKTAKLELFSRYGNLLDPFSHLTKANFNIYSIQLGICKEILQRNTGIEMGDSYIVHLKDDGNYQQYKALDLSDVIKSWGESHV